jgi:predicted ribosomally synthesized peptide with nif11-like leader
MTESAAQALIERMLSDEAFAGRIDAVKHDATAVRAIIAEAGYDVTPDEMREAFLEHFGDQLDEEQLALIAGGLTDDETNGLMVGGVLAGMVVAASAASAAAAA